MAANPNLRVRISADLADIKQGLGVLRSDFAKLKTEAARSGPNTSSWVSGLKAARQQLLGFVAAYASLRSLGALAKVSDEAAGITGRLRLATKSQEEFNAAQDETFAIAQRTQANWKETVGLYSKVAQTADQVGLSQKKQLELTEAVSMALAISGSTGEEANGVMRQFGQALGSSRVQAEEFNSINEGGQRIVQSLAKHLGIATGQVKAYVNAGKVSNKDLAQSQIADLETLRAEYARMPKTISGAFEEIRNSFVLFISNQNNATGSSQAFVGVLKDVAAGLPDFFEPILQVMVQLAKAMKGAETAAEGLGDKASWLGDIGQFLASVFRVVAAAGIVVKNVVEIATVALVSLADAGITAASALVQYVGGAFRNISNSWQALKDEGPIAAMKAFGDGVGQVMDGLESKRQSVINSFRTASSMIRNDAAEMTRGVAALFADIEATTARVRGKPSEIAPDGSGGTSPGKGNAAKAVAASNALMRDSVTRALAELDRLYQGNEIGLKEYFATRLKLQQQSIDLEIEQARMQLAATKDKGQRLKLEEQILKLERDRADAGTAAAREQAKAEEELASALGDVKIRLMELDGRTGAAERAKLEGQYLDLLKRLEAESDKTGQAMVRNLIDRLVDKAKTDELKAAGEKITSALQAKETNVSAQVAGGMLGYGEGERQLAAARAQALVDLRALREASRLAMEAMRKGSPEQAAAVAGIEEIDAQIATVVASQSVWRQKMEDIGASAFGDFLADLTTGAKTFKEAFGDMVKSFVQGVARMIAQEVALRAIRSLMSGWGGAGSVGPVQRESIPVGTLHTGGLAGRGTRRIQVSPMLFGAAPRYHSGGIAGLKPDEVPAILQTGERVLSRSQTKAYDAGGGVMKIEIVNNGSPARVDSAQMSKGGGGEDILKLVLSAVADDFASGGQVARAGASRYDWSVRL